MEASMECTTTRENGQEQEDVTIGANSNFQDGTDNAGASLKFSIDFLLEQKQPLETTMDDISDTLKHRRWTKASSTKHLLKHNKDKQGQHYKSSVQMLRNNSIVKPDQSSDQHRLNLIPTNRFSHLSPLSGPPLAVALGGLFHQQPMLFQAPILPLPWNLPYLPPPAPPNFRFSLPQFQALNLSMPGTQTESKRQHDNTSNKPAAAKKYKCDICAKAFSRSNTLVTHKRIHTGEKPFKCDHCGRAFRQPGNLTRHRLTHTTVKPYVCSQCGKAFNRASNLHTHMRTHTNFRPFLCPFCGKGFHQKIDMKIHSYTHTGERPFKCEICHKGFTLASTLNTHKRTHQSIKPFVCRHCGKDFYQKNSLKSHLLASHPYAESQSCRT